MALSIRAAIIVLAVLGFSPDAQAVPTFTWEGPWNVTLLPVTTQFGTPLGHQAFGASATNGQILDTSSDTAVAKAGTETRTGDAGVSFSRQFELSGSPQGWNVSLTGVLNGGSLALGNGASALVVANAAISPFLALDLSRRDELTQTFPNNLDRLSETETQTAFLSDGLYTVSGLLRTQSSALGGVALSDFFTVSPTNPQPGFHVSVSATAVPEPSSLLLLARA